MSRAPLIDRVRNTKGLGRCFAPDPRDRLHLMASQPTVTPPPQERYWHTGPVLDQGDTPQCVAYSWTGFLLAAPMMDKVVALGGDYEQQLYDKAKTLDEFPGTNYDGTSVRAGAKALQSQGRLKEYLWATSVDELSQYVLTRGPAVIGINWYEEMFLPVKGKLMVAGSLAGGHAILVCGYSVKRQAFRLLNSWGPDWGSKGKVWLTDKDMARLLSEDGEACSAIEQRIAK